MRTLKIAVCLAVCITLAAALPAFASTPEQELADLLRRAIDVLDGMIKAGYTIEHIELDSVRLGEVYSVQYNLYGGNLYKIIGIGGTGIADLDMRVVSGYNNVIAADTLSDDIPEVDVAANADGLFRIDVSFESLEAGHDPNEYYYFCYVVGFRQ